MRYAYFSFTAFALGIVFRSYFDLGWNFSLLILSLGIVLYLASIVRRLEVVPPAGGAISASRSSVLPFTFCFLLFASLGMLRYDLADSRAPRGLDSHLGQIVTVTGVLYDEPLEKGQNMRLVLDVTDYPKTARRSSTSALVGIYASQESHFLPLQKLSFFAFGRSETTTVRARVLVRVPPYPAYQYGDRITMSGTLVAPSNFSPDFDWVNYLKKDEIYYEMQKPQLALLVSGQGNPIIATALRVRQAFLQALRASVPEPESSLGAGITIGASGNTIANLQEDFRRVGLSHVVVVSGYNLTIVGDSIAKMLSLLPRTIALGGGALAVLLFILLTGGGASVLRAAVMASIAILARSTGRLYEALWALMLAGIIMLLWNPRLLVFDLSFQLSFLATLGIIFLAPITNNWPLIRRLHNWKYAPLREHGAATSAALLAVAPLILAKMGNFSFVAIPVNILVLSLIPPSMLLVAITGTISMFSQVLAFPFAAIAYSILYIIIGIAKFFAIVPFASVEDTTFPWWLAMLSYAVIIAYIVRRNRKVAPVPKVPAPSTLGNDFTIEEISH